MEWLDRSNGDPLPWLLELDNPSGRYWTLLDLLDRPADDPGVREAREGHPGLPTGSRAAGRPDCTQARIVRFLIQFGYGDDPRTRAALDWLLTTQRDDGMWLCDRADRHGCLRATLDFLRAAVLDPETAAHPATYGDFGFGTPALAPKRSAGASVSDFGKFRNPHSTLATA
jgi:hypothetical protein